MTDMTELNKKLARLSDMRLKINVAKKKVRDAEGQYDNLREEIKGDLKAADLTNMKNSFVTVTVTPKDDVVIIDQAEVKKWLSQNRFQLDEYLKLDATMVKPILVHALKEDGELVPGTEATHTDVLTVRDRKET